MTHKINKNKHHFFGIHRSVLIDCSVRPSLVRDRPCTSMHLQKTDASLHRDHRYQQHQLNHKNKNEKIPIFLHQNTRIFSEAKVQGQRLFFRIMLLLLGCSLAFQVIYAESINQYIYHATKGNDCIARAAVRERPQLHLLAHAQIAPFSQYIHYLEGQEKKQQQQTQKQTPQNANAIPPHAIPYEMVFVSFSMPRPLLVQVLQDAKRHHVPVVLRGLIDNSFQQTARTFFNLAKQHSNLGGLTINPLWFRVFGITQVPAFVKVTDPTHCSQQYCAPDSFYVVYGNVHIQQAVAEINRAQRLAALS